MTDDRLRSAEQKIVRLETKVDEYAKALVKQASEYERRLTDLNHAHELAIGVQHTYVTQEKFDKAVDNAKTAQDVAFLGVGEKIQSLEAWRSRAVGAGLVLMVFAGVFGALISKAFGG